MHANVHNIIQGSPCYLETEAFIDQKTFLITQDRWFRCKKSGFLAKSEKTFTIRKVNHFH